MDEINFSFEAKDGSITYIINGTVDATIINGTSLSSSVIEKFVNSNKECREYKKVYGLADLMKLREAVLVFLRTEFKNYKVNTIRLLWLNGSDTISLG